jgi:hypothetical protein
MKVSWIGHILCRNCLLKHNIEGEIEERIDVTGCLGRRRRQILDVLKEAAGYWKLKEEAIDRAVGRTGCRRGCGHVLKQTTL